MLAVMATQATAIMRSRRSAIDDEIRPSDKLRLRRHGELRQIGDFVDKPGASQGALRNHVSRQLAIGSFRQIDRRRRGDEIGRNGIDTRPACAPFHGFGLHAFCLCIAGERVSKCRIGFVAGLNKRQLEQFIARRHHQPSIVAWRRSWQSMPHRIRNGESASAWGNHFADFF